MRDGRDGPPDPPASLTTPAPRSSSPPFPDDPLPRIIPGGGISLLAGAPGAGKTALLVSLLKGFVEGTPILGHRPNPLPAIGILSIDRSWQQSTALWFDLVGLAELPHYSMQDDLGFPLSRLRRKPDRVNVLDSCLEEHLRLPWGSLLVVDTLAPFLGGDLNDYDTCMLACMEIRRLCRQRGLTILGLTHAGKQKANPKERYARMQDRILGSAALLGFSDTQMYLATPAETETPHHTFLWNPHHHPPECFTLTRDEATGLFLLPDGPEVMDLADLPAEGLEAVVERMLERVRRHIPAEGTGIRLKPLLSAVNQDVEMSRATLYRCLTRLIEQGIVRQPGRGRYLQVRPA